MRLLFLATLALFAHLGVALIPTSLLAAGCDGFADYADEVLASNFQLVSETPLGGGLSEVELSFELANVDAGDFASVRAFPALGDAATALGLVEPPTPAQFGALGPLAQATPTAHLRVELPSANVATLLAELSAGTLPLTVHADEHDVLAPGVNVVEWTASEDAYYALAKNNFVPTPNPDPGPPPYAPGQQFGIVLFAFGDGVGSVFDAFVPGEELFVVVEGYTPTEVPDAMHFARVLDVTKSDEAGSESSDGFTTWGVLLARTDTEQLPDVFASGSFCTGDSTHIDLPVQATRLNQIDRDVPEAEERDGNPHPIHFNDSGIHAAVELSGQLQGHVLKPSLEIRLREGAVRAVVDIETDLSLTAELRAEASATFDEEASLYDLCFPLPDFSAGPIPIGLNLQLEHVVGAHGSIAAGAVVGFQKSFRGGFRVGYDGRRDPGDRYFSEPHHEQPTPVQFTPPQLLDDTAAQLGVFTELRTTLRVGAKYPLCDTGAGGFVGARASAVLDVQPTQDPWWSLGHEAELFAGIDLQILGLDIASHDTEVELFPGADTLDAGGPLLLTGGPSALARSASAPPPEVDLASGQDQRWAMALDGTAVHDGPTSTAVAELSDGRIVLVTEQRVPGRGMLIQTDRHGAFQWNLKYGTGHEPLQVVALPDDTILVAGAPSWMAHHASDGTLLWSADFTVTDDPSGPLHCVLASVAAIEVSPGQYAFVGVGHHGRGDVRQVDACAFRVSPARTLEWARTYGESGGQSFYDAIVASDGSIVAVGRTETGPDVFSEDNPLVAKLSASDGSVLWAKSLPLITRGGKFNTVAEAPDGTLFAGGAAPRDIRRTGAALVARIDPDGENAHHAMISQDEVWETLIPAAGFVDTEGGDTAYDEIFDLVPTPGGFFFVGRTGLGADTAAWVGKINERLGVEWFRTFDGTEADALDSVTPADGGLLVSGYSTSLGRQLPDDDSQVWLMKLSYEGSADLLPTSGLESRYLAPGVRASSGDDAVVPQGIVSMPAPLIEVDALPDSSLALTPDLLTTTTGICLTRLSQPGRDSDLDDCLDDIDGDGFENDDDNCRLVANPSQTDSDGDSWGNACDADFDGDLVVTPTDFFAVMRPCFGADLSARPECEVADLDGDGAVGSSDFFAVFRPSLGGPPGPSGILGE